MVKTSDMMPFVELKPDEPFFKNTGFARHAKISRLGRWILWRRRRPQVKDFWFHLDDTINHKPLWDANGFHIALIRWRESKPK